MRISDWSSDVCSSDLLVDQVADLLEGAGLADETLGLAGVALMDLPSDLAVHSAPLDVESLDAPHAGAAAGDVHPGGESDTPDSPSAAGRVWTKSQIARPASPRL